MSPSLVAASNSEGIQVQGCVFLRHDKLKICTPVGKLAKDGKVSFKKKKKHYVVACHFSC